MLVIINFLCTVLLLMVIRNTFNNENEVKIKHDQILNKHKN